MKHSLARSSLLVVLAIFSLSPTAIAFADDGGAQPGADVDLAKAHFNTGQIYYDKGRYNDAAHEFEEAYRLSGRAPLLYNVGKSYDGASDFARALDAYRRFAAAAPENSSDREFVDKRVQMLESLVGKIAIDGAAAGSSVTLDGNAAGVTPREPLLVNPGRHSLDLMHEGYANFHAAVDVPVGGAVTLAVKQLELVKVVRVEVQPQRDRRPLYKKWWLWTIVGGVVVAGVVVGVAVGVTQKGPSGPPAINF